MRRIIPAILLIAVLAVGGGVIASAAYQAGLQTAVTTAAGGTGTTVVVPAYGVGYGWHPFGFGFGLFGFLGALLFLVIVFGLIRAIFFGGRHRHWGGAGWGPGGPVGPGGPGPGRPGGSRYDRWEAVLHQDFDAWHRDAHDPAARSTSGDPDPGERGTGSTPPATAG
jgi:hypothetical protein